MHSFEREFEALLDAEAQRIFEAIYQMYCNQEKTDKFFHELIESMIGEKFAFCRSEMVLRVIRRIPQHLYLSNDSRIFIERSEYDNKVRKAVQERRKDLVSAGRMLAAMLAGDYAKAALPDDLLEVFSIFAEELNQEDSLYLIDYIAFWLKMDSGLCLLSLKPLAVKPC